MTTIPALTLSDDVKSAVEEAAAGARQVKFMQAAKPVDKKEDEKRKFAEKAYKFLVDAERTLDDELFKDKTLKKTFADKWPKKEDFIKDAMKNYKLESKKGKTDEMVVMERLAAGLPKEATFFPVSWVLEKVKTESNSEYVLLCIKAAEKENARREVLNLTVRDQASDAVGAVIYKVRDKVLPTAKERNAFNQLGDPDQITMLMEKINAKEKKGTKLSNEEIIFKEKVPVRDAGFIIANGPKLYQAIETNFKDGLKAKPPQQPDGKAPAPGGKGKPASLDLDDAAQGFARVAAAASEDATNELPRTAPNSKVLAV